MTFVNSRVDSVGFLLLKKIWYPQKTGKASRHEVKLRKNEALKETIFQMIIGKLSQLEIH